MVFPVAGIEMSPLVPPAVGLCVGVLSGMFGVGGGFLVAPILMWMGVPPERAVGSELNQMVAASSSGAVLHARGGNVSGRLGLIIAGGGLVASLAGVLIVRALLDSGSYEAPMGALYTILLLVIGVRMILDLRGRKGTAPPQERRLMPAFTGGLVAEGLALGLAAGMLSAFLGVGGGVILVPAMIYLLAVPTRLAIGTSLFQVAAIAFGNTVFHAAMNRNVDVVLAALLMAGSLPGSFIGVWLCGKLRTRSLRGMFGLIVLAVAARMAYGVVRGRQAAFEAGEVSFDSLGPFTRAVREFALGRPVLYGLAVSVFALGVGVLWGAILRGRIGAKCEGPGPATRR